MLNRTTLARPYARAAFLTAQGSQSLPGWSDNLAIAAQVALDETVRGLLENPRFTRGQVLDVFTGVGGDAFDQRFVNFLKTLSTYRRLELLPDIHAQFEALRREAEARAHVLVTSAHPMSDDEQSSLRERLHQRFGRDIELEGEIDPSLIGGAVIRAQDQVIDGSVRGQLERLARQVVA